MYKKLTQLLYTLQCGSTDVCDIVIVYFYVHAGIYIHITQVYVHCAYFKNRTPILTEFFQNFKIGAHSWHQFFFGTFFCQEYGKNTAAAQKK